MGASRCSHNPKLALDVNFHNMKDWIIHPNQEPFRKQILLLVSMNTSTIT